MNYIERYVIQECEEYGIDDHAFCVWAFGDGYESAPEKSFDDRWNALHKDLLFVKGTDSVSETIPKMVQIYLNEQPDHHARVWDRRFRRLV